VGFREGLAVAGQGQREPLILAEKTD
jgi:hypothetical protein